MLRENYSYLVRLIIISFKQKMTTQTIMLSDISLLRLINSCLNFIAQDGNIFAFYLLGFNSETR